LNILSKFGTEPKKTLTTINNPQQMSVAELKAALLKQIDEADERLLKMMHAL